MAPDPIDAVGQRRPRARRRLVVRQDVLASAGRCLCGRLSRGASICRDQASWVSSEFVDDVGLGSTSRPLLTTSGSGRSSSSDMDRAAGVSVEAALRRGDGLPGWLARHLPPVDRARDRGPAPGVPRAFRRDSAVDLARRAAGVSAERRPIGRGDRERHALAPPDVESTSSTTRSRTWGP